MWDDVMGSDGVELQRGEKQEPGVCGCPHFPVFHTQMWKCMCVQTARLPRDACGTDRPDFPTPPPLLLHCAPTN